MSLLRDRDLWYRNGLLINDTRTAAQKTADIDVLTDPKQFDYRKTDSKNFKDYVRAKQEEKDYLISINKYPEIMGDSVKNFLTDLMVDKQHNVRLKGALVIGNVGCGKSEVLKILDQHYNIPFLKALDFRDLYKKELFNKKGIPDDWWDDYLNTDLIIDDIYRETKIIHFGDPYDAIALLIEKRHMVFLDTGKHTFITTNFSLDELEVRYGEPTISRIKQLAEVVGVEGPDMRLMDVMAGGVS